MGIKQFARKMKARRPITRRTKESDSSPSLNRNSSPSEGRSEEDEDTKRVRKLPSIPGALQCIHHEWTKYELERSQWAADRAELEAKVAFLRGQRKGQERLVRDLVCRVKMLEYSLREERAKYSRLKTGTEPARPPPETEGTAEGSSGGEEGDFVPAHDWRQGRQLLRQYLSEIGYTEAVVDINSYRVNSLLRRYDGPDVKGGVAREDHAPATKERLPETDADILAKFAFLPNEEDSDDEREDGEEKFPRGRSEYGTPADETWPAEHSEDVLGDLARLDASAVSERSDHMTWNVKYMLRGHYDSVRSLAFHPVEPVLATASEDGTVILWNLGDLSTSRSCEDLEPSYTFRGHSGPVVCVAVGPNGRWAFSGGLDGSLLCWELPETAQLRDRAGAKSEVTVRLEGHTDVVWGLSHQLYAGRTTLLSCSSDGSVRLWAPEESLTQVSSFSSQDGECPTSVDFCRAEPSRMATAYDTGECVLYDLEYGKPVIWLDTPKENGRINRVVSHPVMPATVTAGEDGCVRFYDDSTGHLVHTTVGHRDSVSSLAIDRYGMYMLTGGHDRTVCVWDVRARCRIQQIHAHGGKRDESVLDVAFHQTRPLVASAGADGCAQVFRPAA